jgi:hypothetical protein
MVLKALGVTRCTLRGLRSMCATTSIWTVDLAHLFVRFGVHVQVSVADLYAVHFNSSRRKIRTGRVKTQWQFMLRSDPTTN